MAANLTIEDAKRRSGISRTTWRDVEKARGSFPSRLVLGRMADALGVPRAELLTLAGYEMAETATAPVDPADRIAQLEDRLARLEAAVTRLRLPGDPPVPTPGT